MIGEVSVRPTPSVEPAVNAGKTLERPVRPAIDTSEPAAPMSNVVEAAEEDAGKIERLRTMLTDPDLRVLTQHDPDSGHTVMRIQDRMTGEVVEQIPSDELLKLYAAIREPLLDQEI